MVLSRLLELVALQGSNLWKTWLGAVATFVCLCCLEGLLRRRSIKEAPPRDLITDSGFWLGAPLFRVASRFLVSALIIALGLIGDRQLGPALFQGFGPIARQPTWLILIEALVLTDFLSYWTHRIMHNVPWLWRFHAIHHSATTIRWSTTARVHPVNEFINYTMGVVPCWLLGFPIAPVLALALAMAWYAIIAHSGVPTAFGKLRGVLVSPRFHLWHHTHSSEGGNKNFANVFSFWDRLFGSYYLPLDREATVFGLDGEPLPENYLAQLWSPFKRASAPQPALPSDRPLRKAS